MVGLGGGGGGLGSGLWSRLFQGARWTHRVVTMKQRLTTLKIFGFKLIKLQKPVLGGVAVFSASLGYQEWSKVRHALKITANGEEMSILFDQLDHDHNGSLDRNELTLALKKAGVDVNQLQVELMMHSADENDDDQISKEEWLHICEKLSQTHPQVKSSSSLPSSSSSSSTKVPASKSSTPSDTTKLAPSTSPAVESSSTTKTTPSSTPQVSDSPHKEDISKNISSQEDISHKGNDTKPT